MSIHRYLILACCAASLLAVGAGVGAAEPPAGPARTAAEGDTPAVDPADLLKRIERLEKALRARNNAPSNRLQKENAALRRRIGQLESEMRQLRDDLAKQRADADTPDPEVQKLRAAIDAIQTDLRLKDNRRPILSALDVELYGYVKLDASWDSHEINPGNFALWATSELGNSNDDEFNMTANQTRLGLRIKGPDVEGVKTSGLIEGDFYGGGDENKPRFRMRHAYLQLDWPEDRLSLLAGQTWDVVAPLWPGTLNFTINWDAGNIGYRRPQIRLTKDVWLDGERTVNLCLQGALSRTIGRAAIGNTDTGADSGHPTVQGRAALTFPLLAGRPATIGAWGHWGREEYDVDAFGRDETFDSWSAGMDLAIPLADWLTVKAEIFTGEALDSYFGGIGQGMDAGRLDALGACGGWLAAAFKAADKWTFNLGAGIDALDADDATVAGARVQNRMVFGNVIYAINSQTSVGLEVSHWHTDYEHQSGGDALRLQSSFIYRF